ncbi:hypothetical protein COLO4_03809 [Corchorus olitorius]|uniref:Uncharacterized protein n=1 Tax=Corchorus olitorius TaxID=93759 RepID=A0A1R3KWN2_9ROSI|nr:hypothetical protein COLO4_03809 [Corchorus olitorius]
MVGASSCPLISLCLTLPFPSALTIFSLSSGSPVADFANAFVLFSFYPLLLAFLFVSCLFAGCVCS